MSTNTLRLGIPNPLGNETVSRAGFITIFNTIDAEAATRKEPEILAQDIYVSGFVTSGMMASNNLIAPDQLDVMAGVAYIPQAGGGLRRYAPDMAEFDTTMVSTTYYLDFQPDGTYSWGTGHSGQAGYLPIAEVVTDSSGNITVVADKRVMVPGAGLVNADRVRGREITSEFDDFRMIMSMGGMV